ncbi:MAG: hypothetical protein JRD89_00770 [Deltaproteobacteria bacterium]|nr:hypothetical protein [Deltaproteobacteria bacterium]
MTVRSVKSVRSITPRDIEKKLERAKSELLFLQGLPARMSREIAALKSRIKTLEELLEQAQAEKERVEKQRGRRSRTGRRLG